MTPRRGVATTTAEIQGDLDELADVLVTTSRALIGIAVRSLGAVQADITVTQHRALVLVDRADATSVGALAVELGVNQSNASRLVGRLERLGLLSRERSADDGRATVLSLTDAGRSALDQVAEARRAELVAILAQMSPIDHPAAAETARVLRSFNAAAHEDQSPR